MFLADLTGQMRLTIRFAPIKVLASDQASPGEASASYQLTNCYGVCSVYALNDGLYNNSIMARLQQAGPDGQEIPIEVKYKHYYFVSENSTNGAGSVRWNMATNSLDKVHVTRVATANRSDAAPIDPDIVYAMTSKYFSFSGSDSQNFQLLFQGSYYPSFPIIEPEECFPTTQAAFNQWNNIDAGAYITHGVRAANSNLDGAATGQDQWKVGRWGFTTSFELPYEHDPHVSSGINTYGSMGVFQLSATDNGAAASTWLVFTETSPILQILSQKRIAVKL
tara:strand:- start:1303 stop:2139 length:837 start_codon:yes stop_codon:yes gene_type:complete